MTFLIIEDKEAFTYATKNKLATIYDLLAHCKHKSGSEAICKDILPLIRFDSLAELITNEQRRLSNFVKETDINTNLKKRDLRTFGSLYNYIEQVGVQGLEPDLEKLLSVLRAPISILTNDRSFLSKLDNLGYSQVFDLLLPADISSLLTKSKLSDKQNISAKTMIMKLSFVTIADIITADCYPINIVSFIDDTTKRQLIRAGYSTISHLNVSDEILMKTSGLKTLPLSRIKKILTTPF